MLKFVDREELEIHVFVSHVKSKYNLLSQMGHCFVLIDIDMKDIATSNEEALNGGHFKCFLCSTYHLPFANQLR